MCSHRSLGAWGLLALALLLTASARAQSPNDDADEVRRANPSASGVFPHLAPVAEHEPRSEAGIGALMPWADRLWMVNYPAHKKRTGRGHGLFSVSEDLEMTKRPESVVGTYANRMIHDPTDQLLMGPYAIDTTGSVRVLDGLKGHRLAATMTHLDAPDERVYYLTMEGLLLEATVTPGAPANTQTLFDLKDELGLPEGFQPHFKSGYTAQGRVIIGNNAYHEEEATGQRRAGRLASWDGSGDWKILARQPFVEVAGHSGGYGRLTQAVYALGWDRASVILKVLEEGEWSTYRLPKASHAWDHAWTTEWMRIREVESEHLLMDAAGMFYELPLHVYGGSVWGIQPISRHLRVVPDFTAWRGFLVMAGNQTTVVGGNQALGGQPQSGLWLGKTDDLWQWGDPEGWGGPWRESRVEGGDPSDPYLMTGFGQKGLHLAHESDRDVTFTVEVDFLGNGTWKTYDEITVPPGGYEHHEFPDGFGAHWVRLRPSADAEGVTAQFVYN